MIARRDIHGEGTHNTCPDSACCLCDCFGCKRTWFEEGRPSPDDCQTHGVRALMSEGLGRTGYRAYGATTDFKNYMGNPMPTFDELPPPIQTAWMAFAARVAAGGEAPEGYEAYGDSVGWKNFQGKPMPKWAQAPMTEKITEAWIAAANSIRAATTSE